MKNKFIATGCIVIAYLSIANITFASHYVRGYTKKNGTYVQGHTSMDPYESRRTGMSYHNNNLEPRDNTKDNNYSGFGINKQHNTPSGGLYGSANQQNNKYPW